MIFGQRPFRTENIEESFMWRDLCNVLHEMWEATNGAGGSYRPDLHYMRGPGPKSRAAYATVPIKSSRPIPCHVTEQRI